jgi:hypothetical protein
MILDFSECHFEPVVLGVILLNLVDPWFQCKTSSFHSRVKGFRLQAPVFMEHKIHVSVLYTNQMELDLLMILN